MTFGIGQIKLAGQHGVSLVYAPSKVIKHSSALLFDVPGRSHEVRLTYTYQTTGKNRWERYWRKPRIAINAVFVDFGDSDILGNAVGLLPEMHFTLKKWNTLRLNLQFGTGIARLNRPFDAITNPINNAIGSNLNNISSLKFGLEYRWNKQWITTLSTGLVHFSNGLSSSPNKGINIYGVSIGGLYTIGKDKPEEELSDPTFEDEPTHFRRWIFDAQFHYGFTEYTVPGGPKFSVNAYSIGLGYRYSEFMTLSVGGEYEFNDATYTFFKRNFYTEDEALERARSTIVYIENELRYGCVFNRFRLGFYLPYPIDNTRDFYTKMTTGLYLPTIAETTRPYIGVVLKTHMATADYLGIVFGVSI